jgi:hypothetical protein
MNSNTYTSEIQTIGKPILIVPINDGSRYLNFEYITSQKSISVNPAIFVINREIFSPTDTLEFYNHIGEYVITSSSFDSSNDLYIPENAFNYSNKGWKSNNLIIGSSNTITTVEKNNSNVFSSSSITSSSNYANPHFGPSYFNQTTSKKNIVNTNIITNTNGDNTKNNIIGEWLQIKLPQPIYLYNYTIKVPIPKLIKTDKLKDFLNNYNITPPSEPNYSKYYSDNNISNYYISHFPKVFTVVGSLDGNNWYYVDHQSFVSPPDLSFSYIKNYSNPNLSQGYDVINDGRNTQITFQINSIDHFNCFRLIVSELFPGNKQVQINEWDLYAFVDIVTPNPNSKNQSRYNKKLLNSNGSIETFISKTNSLDYLTGMQSKFDSVNNIEEVDNGLMKIYKDQLKNINIAKQTTILPNLEGFTLSKIENFDSHGFVSYNGNTDGNLIINNQITPLNYIHTDFLNLQKSVNQSYFDLSNNIYDFSNNFYTTLNTPNDHYDMSLNNFNKPPTKEDAWINDNKQMVLEQNSIYILSTITITTLIIALILVSR